MSAGLTPRAIGPAERRAAAGNRRPRGFTPPGPRWPGRFGFDRTVPGGAGGRPPPGEPSPMPPRPPPPPRPPAPRRLQQTFLAAVLPRVEAHGRVYFRHVKCPHRKEDLQAELRALAW